MSISKIIQNKIESSGERFWRFADFENLPVFALAQTLSRLCRKGLIIRIGKGLYYKPRQTPFGQSKPNMNQLSSLLIPGKKIFPAGIGAANLLGFNTQNPSKAEIATNGLSLPRLFVGKKTIIHTRRPESWRDLTNNEAAILDFLRSSGESSELSPEETVRKLIEHFSKSKHFERLFYVAMSEPPRVRAILGAIGQEIGCQKNCIITLKKGLNPLSRFNFGKLISLKYAKQWQAK